MSYDNTNRGAIWKNEDKETDTHPDFKGNANVDGIDYWVSAWKRKPDANPKAPPLSFSFKMKEQQPNTSATPDKPADDFTDDSIPF